MFTHIRIAPTYDFPIKDRVEFLEGAKHFILSTKPEGYKLKILELGVLRGEYSESIVKCFGTCDLYLVDTWCAEGNDPYFSKNQPELNQAYALVKCKFMSNSNVTIISMESAEAASRFADGFFDLIYIDANHTKEAFERDLNIWLPKMKTLGVIAGHDFGPDPSVSNIKDFGIDGVVKAKFGTEYGLTGEQFYKTWYHIITE